MDIEHQTVETGTIVTIRGDLDGKTAPTAQHYIEQITPSAMHLLLDMREVAFMSSAGLRLLLALHRTVAESQGKLVLVGLSEDIEDTMTETGFLAYFTVCKTLDEGLVALQG